MDQGWIGELLAADDSVSQLIARKEELRTYISFLTPSGRFVATAVACDAFLFMMPLDGIDILLAFRVAATLFADIRRAILKEYLAQ
jgi:hypothetical protein